MGSISNQAIKSTFFSYLGVILGFITVGYLFPKILTTSEVGVIRLILNYSEIASRIAALGTTTLIIRYFAHFKDEKNRNNGFLSYMMILNIVGFAIFFIAYYFISDFLIERNKVNSPLFSEYFYWIVPVTLSFVVFHLFDRFSTALKMSAIGTFFREFIQRLFLAVLLIYLWFVTTPFPITIFSYFTIVLATPLFLMLFLYFKKKLVFGLNHSFLQPKLVKEMSTVASFALLTGLGGTTVVLIDNIMINELMSEAETGIYSTIFFYTTLILIPTKGISKIASSFIADSFINNQLDKVKSIYYKSCMNQFLPGLFIFIMIWVNRDFIFYILPEEYGEGRYLLLILGIGNLFNAITGANTQVIAYSPLHKFNTVFVIGLLIITVISNYILIPIYGITGAAIATALSLLIFNSAKYILLWVKYGFQPFNLKYVLLAFIGVATILITDFIHAPNAFVQAILKTITGGILFSIPALYFKVSPEINDFLAKTIQPYLPSKKQ